jgi:hypothetical protein
LPSSQRGHWHLIYGRWRSRGAAKPPPLMEQPAGASANPPPPPPRSRRGTVGTDRSRSYLWTKARRRSVIVIGFV